MTACTKFNLHTLVSIVSSTLKCHLTSLIKGRDVYNMYTIDNISTQYLLIIMIVVMNQRSWGFKHVATILIIMIVSHSSVYIATYIDQKNKHTSVLVENLNVVLCSQCSNYTINEGQCSIIRCDLCHS